MPQIGQSTVVATALLAVFFVFVLARGRIPLYLGILGLGNSSSTTTTSGTSTGSDILSTLGITNLDTSLGLGGLSSSSSGSNQGPTLSDGTYQSYFTLPNLSF